MVLRELTGPSLHASLVGWLLELDDGAVEGWGCSTAQAWGVFGRGFPAQVKRLLPELSCSVPEHPIDCCVDLARQLVDPVRLRCLPLRHPAAPRDLVRRALIRSSHHALAGDALRLALTILNAITLSGPSRRSQAEALSRAVVRIQRRAHALTSHAFTNGVLDQAGQRGLLLEILHEQLGFCPALQIGSGSRSRLMVSTALDTDSYLGGYACRNKAYSQQILRRLGYPVPRHVQLPSDVSPAQLAAAVRVIGYPCVVKPMDAELGQGVSIDIRDEATLLRAAEQAREAARAGLLLEEHVPGDYHRLVVMEGSLVRVGRFQPPHLVGDGQRTIRAILAEPSSDSSQPGAVLCSGPAPALNDSMLRQLRGQGWTPDGVPAAGERVVLRCDLRDRDDWVCESILDRVDPSLHRLASGVARALGMANVGIDVLSPDISQPAASRQLWVIEVNAIQRLHPATAPLFLQTIFPDDQSAHIPISVVVCVDEKHWPDHSRLKRLLDEHPGFGLALPERLAVQLDPLMRLEIEKDRAIVLYRHPREVLMNRCLDAVLFLIDWRELSHSGLPSPWVDQLQLLGRPPGGMAKSWQRLLDCARPRAAENCCCPLPAWSLEWS